MWRETRDDTCLGDGRERAVGFDNDVVETSQSKQGRVLFGVVSMVADLVHGRFDLGEKKQLCELDDTVAEKEKRRETERERISLGFASRSGSARVETLLERDRTYLETPIYSNKM